jgi:hypothetical protein
MKTQGVEVACGRCKKRRLPLRAVQMRREGKANEYVPEKIFVCDPCRKAIRGHFRYWR